MKRLLHLLVLALSLCLLASSQSAEKHGATYGVHGMVLFGNSEGMYVSHLPMFHAPHDYQVVLQIRCADAKLDKLIKRRLEQKPVLWTMEPEQFEMARLALDAKVPLNIFRANVVLGHFERGGTTEYRNVPVVVEKTVIFRQLSPAMRNSDMTKYQQIGKGQKRFLLKEIDSRPDFDHVLAVSLPANVTTEDIQLKKTGLHAASEADFLKVLQDKVGKPVSILGTVYLDHADLE
ncbi:hypothetical protein [Undibacterium sp. TS12]|uniref:hypothetical protein n=1 Tax=Undibacterium sp. TS12 TaxID=2908202 RepID=UPI001F4C84CC|nr:hypothetical protein [Undibacterium sp. TS12]MCH8619458.1 hypothetical protein [Undibacterium sp. TS12]